ncbi:MAG: hypothetical protein ACJ76V_03645, partial [Thermoleophilaceae bacterium]
PWLAGEAGTVTLGGPGAVQDIAGNWNLAPKTVLVSASPGDFTPPLVTSLSIKPRTICLTKARRCKKPGATVSFVTSEPGRLSLIVTRGTKRVGVRNFTIDKAGKNQVNFNGVVRSKKLRAGTYLIEASMADAVGNDTTDPPFATVKVKRTTR